MSQFFNDREIQNPGSELINCGPEKIWRKKKLRIFKKMLFSWEGLLNTYKRQQIAKTITCTWYMFTLLEIARINKALQLFADLQGSICYKDPQNKGINLIVY